jgi:23S rRNA pseudouridine1911/1915/1917 synthase
VRTLTRAFLLVMTESLVVLYEDPHCLAVDKPAGVLSQGTPGGEPTLEAAVRRYLNPGRPDAVYLGTVHRLDRPVSGVLLWAKTPKAARRLAEQFARREPRKEYWAVVEGDAAVLDACGTWDDWLTDEVGPERTVRAGDARTPGVQRAVTRFRRGEGARLPAGTAWLRLWPETGRTHQLRAQAALRGLAIVGDVAYGALRRFPAGIALHARTLQVRHPISRRLLTWTAPLPASWGEQGIEIPPVLPEP